ncbi:hypothetical protein [Haloglomus halophilum]|uniref:hypothetical protein n=1 Tax=Haloglomus halophilum TaxID=2962672 RepID=UPI0020C98426|nr:hypothetical protein [Haloglomus halophilum]
MYDKSLLAKGTGLSLGVVALVAMLVLHTGTAYAVPLAGVGGFTVKADEIRGQDAHIYVGVGDTSEKQAIPVGVTELESSEIEGLKLIKELSVESLPGLSGDAKMVISGTGTVTTGNQILKASRIQADQAVLREQVIDESPASDPNDRFTIDAQGNASAGETVDPSLSSGKPGLVLKNATINAHYLATNRISIPGQKITIQYDPDDDGTYEQQYGQ